MCTLINNRIRSSTYELYELEQIEKMANCPQEGTGTWTKIAS